MLESFTLIFQVSHGKNYPECNLARNVAGKFIFSRVFSNCQVVFHLWTVAMTVSFLILLDIEGVHLALPPHIIFVQEKSQSILHHGSLGASLKQNKRNLILTPNHNP